MPSNFQEGSKSLPYFSVLVNGVPIPQYTPCVQIIQKTNAHAIALLDVLYVGSNISNPKRNSWTYLPEHTPIQINYGMRPYFVYPFVGYVSSYKLIKSGTDKGFGGLSMTRVQYTITGSSQVMQTTKNKAWKHTSHSTIAGNIAVENGMRAIVHSYVSAIDYRLQNTSDFRFLNQLAHEIGFKFYVDNTDLYFVNPQTILDKNNLRATPTFWLHNQPGLWDTIRVFEPTVGTITPDGGISANRNIVGLNPHTNQIVQNVVQPNLTVSESNSASIAPVIDKFYNEHPAESYYEAVQKSQGDFLRNLYWNTAKACVWGDARVKPNTVITMQGAALPSNDQGEWLVDQVTHRLELPPPTGAVNTATYYMDMSLVRDQIYTTVNSALSETSTVNQPVAPALVGGAWRSSNIGASIYAT